MYFHGFRISPQADTQQERPMKEVRPAAARRCTAGETSPSCTHSGEGPPWCLHWHLALIQLQSHWLAACADPRLQLREGGGKGLKWLASVNTNTFGVKTDEICRKFMVVTLAISFISGQKLSGSFSEQVTGNCNHSSCVANTGRCCSSLFLAISVCLIFAVSWMG